MSDDPQVAVLRQLTALMQRYGLSELEVREAGVTIRLSAAAEANAPPPVVESTPAPARPEGPPAEQLRTLVSPLTGTFYRAPSPTAPPFVEAGSSVEPGQFVGLIEAMKQFSEVPADCAGTVHAIYAEDGHLVQQGEPLLAILLEP